MQTEKGVMKTETIFSDDRRHRYLLRKEWDTKKPKATIIMTNPSTADISMLDYTTLYIINNLVRLDFGAVDIVNLVSKTTTKLQVKEDIADEMDKENLDQYGTVAYSCPVSLRILIPPQVTSFVIGFQSLAGTAFCCIEFPGASNIRLWQSGFIGGDKEALFYNCNTNLTEY